MNLLHVRHATSIITYAGVKILVDPVFAPKETYNAIPLTPNRRQNPLVDLSTSMDIILDVDFILNTHIHNDHFDMVAYDVLNKELPVLCQEEDEISIREKGFVNVFPIQKHICYGTITITRVAAQHGCGEIGKRMGIASGYILQSEGEPTLYITGDTIYNDTIKSNIGDYNPQILLINAGSPKFLNSNQIVMNIMDLEKAVLVNPDLVFIVVHLDAFNHCIETREDIREYFSEERLHEMGVKSFFVPEDNELMENI